MRNLRHWQYPLDRVFSASSHIAILHALQHRREGMSGRAIAREARLNHQACAVASRNLESMGLLRRSGAGHTQLVALNFDNYLIRELLLPLFRKERDLLDTVRKEIVDAFAGALAVTLYGSVARGQDSMDSDMDVLIVVPNDSKLKAIDRATHNSAEFMVKYGLRLSPLVMTLAEARRRAQKGDSLLRNILAEGVDLSARRLSQVIGASR
ncbi:MAG: nucleotidyltransferase domain-containing protein [Elusimicrobia bacterium]|nr:nucleotidyltransferase domain-containing protein [Candidatus Obscuribacterium magneticum]